MAGFDRRTFLGASIGGLSGLATVAPMFGKEGDSDKKKVETKPATPTPPKPVSIKMDKESFETLFLTWQRDPTTTMTVQWIGPDVHDTEIKYATLDKDAAWQLQATLARPYPFTNLLVFRAELTNLKPGTEYQFRIGNREKKYRFRTMPAKATDAFHFVSGGDCGTNDHAIANNIMAARQNPMFALIGGDLGYDDGRKPDISVGFMRNYSQHMIDHQRRLIPMVVCIGNHEVNGGYGKTRKEAPFYFALHDGLYSERSYATLDFGDYLSLVLLDTGHVAKIDGEQTAWLDKTLAERAERPHLIVANHVPAYPSFRKVESTGATLGTGQLNRTHWSPLFEKHLVDAVLEHHDHTFKRTHTLKDGHVDKNGVMYLGDGSWGRLRPPSPPEARPYLATVSQSYHLTLHRLEGEQRFHMAMEEGGRIVDVCMTGKRLRRPVGRGA